MFYSPFKTVSDDLNKLKQSLNNENLLFDEDLVCKCCKTRLSDFLETGYVGCSQCYKLFEKDIMPMIYNFHKAVKHTGKRPERIASKALKQQEIEKLLKLQAEASAREDFLLAQSYKEKIEKLRSEYNG